MAKLSGNNYAFIDSQNLNLAINDQGWRLDFKKYRKYLSHKYSIKKAYLFIGYLPKNQSLYNALEDYGYILIFKNVLKTSKGVIKGNVDAELVLHSMIQYKNYDKALIVSGDGDFFCLVDYLLEKKKLLKLMVPNKSQFSSLYRKKMPHLIFMNNLKQNLEHKNKQK